MKKQTIFFKASSIVFLGLILLILVNLVIGLITGEINI